MANAKPVITTTPVVAGHLLFTSAASVKLPIENASNCRLKMRQTAD